MSGPLLSRLQRCIRTEHVAIPSDYGTLWEAIDTLADLGGGPAAFIRNSRWYYGILREAQKRGAAAMLEGQAGNLTSSYSAGFGLYDLRRRCRWLQLASAARNRHREGMRWATIARAIWMPGQKANARLQRLRRKPLPALFDQTLMREDFYRSTTLPQKEFSSMGSTIEGDRTNGTTWRFSILAGGDMGGMRAMHMRGFGLRREDPTADTRLVELMLSFPDEAFAPNGKRLEANETVSRYIDLPRMRAMLDSFHERKARNKSEADSIFNYTVGGALAFGRFVRRMEERSTAQYSGRNSAQRTRPGESRILP